MLVSDCDNGVRGFRVSGVLGFSSLRSVECVAGVMDAGWRIPQAV